MPTRFVPPWDPAFTNTVNTVWTDVADVVNQVVPGVVPPAPPQVPPAINISPAPLPAPTPAPVPAPVPAAPTAGPTTAAAGTLATSATAAFNQAWPALSAQLEKDFMAYAEQYLQGALTGNVTPQIPDVTYNGQSLTHAAAKGHAWRTFLLGFGATALSAILSAIAMQADPSWFLSRDGWVATAGIAVSTLVTTLTSYIARLQITPDYEKQLAAAPSIAIK